jgi:hypothetical protein
MDSCNDAVFGQLTFEFAWMREIDVPFLGQTSHVELIVEGNDEEETILDEQRICFQQYQESEADNMSRIETALFEYYQGVCDDYRYQFGADADARMPLIQSPADLFALVELTGMIFPIVMNPGEKTMGFLLECAWEPELGLGVKLTDGKIEVGGQDLLI